jgi:hypothetical protein
MELIIEQEVLKANYEYKIYVDKELIYISKINRTIATTLRKIHLYDRDGNEICCLKQESWLKLILQNIPFVCLFSFAVCPYIFYRDGIRQGYLREAFDGDWVVIGEIDNDKYEIWDHTGNNMSIYCNEKQVGAITRDCFKLFDGDKYKILYNRNFDRELAIMCSLLADVLWNTSDDNIYGCSWEWGMQLDGKKINKNWKPED